MRSRAKINRILLINPPGLELYKGFRDFVYKFPPLGLCYLASFLENHEFEAEIYDCLAEDATLADIEKRISSTEAGLVGITSNTSTISEAAEISSIARKYAKTVVIGGPHATALPSETLRKFDCFDYAVLGEGEVTLLELISGKDPSHIDGLAYRVKDQVMVNRRRDLIEDLSATPHPARHLLNNGLYRPPAGVFCNDRRLFTIITSRGCPFSCTFCASKTLWGGSVRFRSLDDVFSELDELRQAGMVRLWIVDDTFTLDMDRVSKIAEKLKSMGIAWACNARIGDLTRKALKLLKSSNCEFIQYGIESGNQNILYGMKKGITLEQAREAVNAAKAEGINVCCNFIIGNIGDTEETVRDTIRFAKELSPDLALFGMLAVYPGTEAHEIAKKRGYIDKDFDKYTNPKYCDPVLKLPGISPEKMKRLLAEAYMSYYLRPAYLLRFAKKSFSSYQDAVEGFKLIKAFMFMRKRLLSTKAEIHA